MKLSERQPLTADIVRALPEGKTAWDPGVIGFGARGGKTQTSFFLNYRIDGRDKRHTIGTFPLWSVDAARAEAKKLRKEVDRGRDPAGEKRERREAPDIQDLIDRYVREHLSTKAPHNHRDELRMLREVGDILGYRTKVRDVHGGDLAALHRKISESPSRVKGGLRKPHANRVLALASKMFSLSLVPMAGETAPWRDQAMGNPCKGIKRNPEYGRERFFSEAELAAIADALATYPSQRTADCVRLVMATGCRPHEAIEATWEQFDDEPGFWIKPASTTKQRRVHKLPLSPPALELIARLRESRSGDLVFPGRTPGRPLGALEYVWEHVRRECGFTAGERIYDLRHTFASIGASSFGLSLPVIGRLLGHSVSKTTQRYAHLSDSPLKQAAAQIGGMIANAGKTPKGTVDTLKRRQS
jgi:integrase